MSAALVLVVSMICSLTALWTAPTADERGAITAKEVARVRHHLEGAEAHLVARNVSNLSEAQRAARARAIRELRSYRLRGVFPHNHHIHGRTPVFVDEHGTRCAMAHLIEQTGATALVARISRTWNLARVRDLADEPELVAWLDRNGITLEEAARIQPEYDDEPDEEDIKMATAIAGAAFGSMGVGLNVSLGDTQNSRNVRGLSGMVLGLMSIGFGMASLEGDVPAVVLGSVDIFAGAASIGLGIRQLNASGPVESVAANGPAFWTDRDGVRRFALVARF